MHEDTAPERLVERTVYGEDQPDAEANNLRGKRGSGLRQAGVVTSDAYDFKGNLLRSRRQLCPGLQDDAGLVSRHPAAKTEIFTSRTTLRRAQPPD